MNKVDLISKITNIRPEYTTKILWKCTKDELEKIYLEIGGNPENITPYTPKNTPVRIDRRIDGLGRISIPYVFKNQLNLQNGDYISISINEDTLVIKKVE